MVVLRQTLSRNGWPLDPVDRELGNWCCLDLLEVVGAVTKVLHRGGLPPEEAPEFLEEVRENLKDRNMRVYTSGEFSNHQ